MICEFKIKLNFLLNQNFDKELIAQNYESSRYYTFLHKKIDNFQSTDCFIISQF